MEKKCTGKKMPVKKKVKFMPWYINEFGYIYDSVHKWVDIYDYVHKWVLIYMILYINEFGYTWFCT